MSALFVVSPVSDGILQYPEGSVSILCGPYPQLEGC